MIITKEMLIKSFKELGLEKNDRLMVHTSLSSFGGIVSGGAQTIIEALMEIVSEEGLIMMPTQSWKNLDPDTGVHGTVTEEEANVIRQTWPAFNKRLTPTNTMGSVAEMFRLWPNTYRSSHPSRSLAAWGKGAEDMMVAHDLSDIFGPSSPLQKLYELKGKVLLIGVGHDKNTSIHLADALAEYPSKHHETHFSAMTINDKRVWQSYNTLYVDGEDFEEIGEAFENKHDVSVKLLGEATLKLMSQCDLVDFSVEWIEKNRR
ncbi:AAC(3) family N-acetyltransferase [Vagococcus sp. DIV0080]|uniref:Aminoglycoside N(3)-acetyltransferase n=1 Tax=Candidatus Vagococcus giribetii TaxID=2230876 RepID=A0ABS3HP59_9ENTE|nr:AAC(3) family N-acetyltransferase [Vagococcus sp. DIV0080]MBO0475525.1 AAC(3) family N-acetyltransferase [Vagococcus sp. DIV0080]